jgi:hypothetical protein
MSRIIGMGPIVGMPVAPRRVVTYAPPVSESAVPEEACSRESTDGGDPLELVSTAELDALPLVFAPSSSGVYFLLCEGRIKIGWSRCIARRVEALATAAPGRPRLVGYIASWDEGLERQLHARFAMARRHREWFAPVRALVDFFEREGAR